MSINNLFKTLATLVLGLVALLFCTQLWRAYVLAPWTRDGRVSAHVIRMAPEVSGQVEHVLVGDNQWVAKGALLYRIDQRAYLLAQQQRAAELAEARSVFAQRTAQLQRRSQLGDAIAREETDTRRGTWQWPRPAWRRPRASWPKPGWTSSVRPFVRRSMVT